MLAFFPFQRGSDELLPSGIVYGPLTMSNSTPATGTTKEKFVIHLHKAPAEFPRINATSQTICEGLSVLGYINVTKGCCNHPSVVKMASFYDS